MLLRSFTTVLKHNTFCLRSFFLKEHVSTLRAQGAKRGRLRRSTRPPVLEGLQEQWRMRRYPCSTVVSSSREHSQGPSRAAGWKEQKRQHQKGAE
jgi:hypothetical protein